jgi:predicted RNA binding protein YcfA (HicA-like mRNA interferase family)
MPKLKVLSGKEIISIFGRLGFLVVSQRGSHVKLRRINARGVRETLTIPTHDEIDIGTLRAIVHQASSFLTDEVLKAHFYA